MSAPATNDYCRANLAFKVSEGEVNGIDMSGLVFVIIVDAPALMSDGGWKVGVVVNEATTDEQMGALGEVMSGDIGGPAAMLKDMIGEMLGMERHPVSIDAKGNDFHITIGQSFEYNATIIAPKFDLITNDFQNISSLNIEKGLYPCFADLDNDGDNDMLLGDFSGNLHYFENTSSSVSSAMS